MTAEEVIAEINSACANGSLAYIPDSVVLGMAQRVIELEQENDHLVAGILEAQLPDVIIAGLKAERDKLARDVEIMQGTIDTLSGSPIAVLLLEKDKLAAQVEELKEKCERWIGHHQGASNSIDKLLNENNELRKALEEAKELLSEAIPNHYTVSDWWPRQKKLLAGTEQAG